MRRMVANAALSIVLAGVASAAGAAEQPRSGGDVPSARSDEPEDRGAGATDAVRAEGIHANISRAEFRGNGRTGLCFGGEGNTVNLTRCKITDNGGVGLCVMGTNNRLNVSGGEIRGNKVLGIFVGGENEVNIRGGLIEDNIVVCGSTVVNIYGTNLALSGTQLTGVLADGTPIEIRIAALGTAKVLLHEVTDGKAEEAGR